VSYSINDDDDILVTGTMLAGKDNCRSQGRQSTSSGTTGCTLAPVLSYAHWLHA